MNKKLILAMFALFSVTMVYADQSIENMNEIRFLISDDLNKNYDSISELSSILSYAQKDDLYVEHEQSALAPAILNFFIGFGLGSIMQDDSQGFKNQLIGDSVGILIMGGGMALAIHSLMNLTPDDSSSYPDGDIELNAMKYFGGIGLVFLGNIVITVSNIVGIVRAFEYSEKYNKTLKQALYSRENTSKISLRPILTENACGLSIGLSF